MSHMHIPSHMLYISVIRKNKVFHFLIDSFRRRIFFICINLNNRSEQKLVTDFWNVPGMPLRKKNDASDSLCSRASYHNSIMCFSYSKSQRGTNYRSLFKIYLKKHVFPEVMYFRPVLLEGLCRLFCDAKDWEKKNKVNL